MAMLSEDMVREIRAVVDAYFTNEQRRIAAAQERATLHTPPPVATATVDAEVEDRVLTAVQAELSRQADESTAMPYVGERDDDDQILDGSFDLRSLARVAIAATPSPVATATVVDAGEAVEIIREMLRLSDMGFEASLHEPEENGNFAVYERAKRFLAATPTPPAGVR